MFGEAFTLSSKVKKLWCVICSFFEISPFNKQTRYVHSPSYAVHTNVINKQTCLIHFYCSFFWTLFFSVLFRPNFFQGYVVLLLVTTIGKFQLQHLLMGYVLNHCHQDADIVWKAPFCCDNLMDGTRSNSNIVLSYLIFFPILLNLMQKVDYFVPIFGLFWPYLAKLKSRRM